MLIIGLIGLLTFPGVWANALFRRALCHVSGLEVTSVCYFRLGHSLNAVVHSEPGNCREAVVTWLGPFLLSSFVGPLVALPSTLRVFEFAGAASMADVFLVWVGVSIAVHAIPSIEETEKLWEFASKLHPNGWVKMLMGPLAGLLALSAWVSRFGLNLVYGLGICALLPQLMARLAASC